MNNMKHLGKSFSLGGGLTSLKKNLIPYAEVFLKKEYFASTVTIQEIKQLLSLLNQVDQNQSVCTFKSCLLCFRTTVSAGSSVHNLQYTIIVKLMFIQHVISGYLGLCPMGAGRSGSSSMRLESQQKIAEAVGCSQLYCTG